MKVYFLGLLMSTLMVGCLLLSPVNVAAENVKKIELYTTSWCPYCRKAEAFLKANNIEYVNYDIEKDKVAAARKRGIDPRKGVPLAMINGQVIYGFSEKLYRTALELDE